MNLTNNQANIILDIYEDMKAHCNIQIAEAEDTINVYAIAKPLPRVITAETTIDFDNADLN